MRLRVWRTGQAPARTCGPRQNEGRNSRLFVHVPSHGHAHLLMLAPYRRFSALMPWKQGYNITMFYMVVETYRDGPGPVYERAAERAACCLKACGTSTAG